MRLPFMRRHREPEVCKLGKHFDHDHVSGCGRCRRTWCFAEGHGTWYEDNQGMSPLCEDCWGALTPERRLPYYHELHDGWVSEDRLHPIEGYDVVAWRVVEGAVLAE